MSSLEIKKSLLQIIKSQRCNVNPQALQLLVVAATIIPEEEDRNSFLQSVIMQSSLSADRTIEPRAAREAISALIPSLQSARIVTMQGLATLQALATGQNITSAVNNNNTQQQQQQTSGNNSNNNQQVLATTLSQARPGTQTQLQQQQAFMMSTHQSNFKVISFDEMPVLHIDEATCASFRLTRAHRGSTLRNIALESERARMQSTGNAADPNSASLETLLTKKSDTCARTIAIRTRLALALGRVGRCTTEYQTNSLLRGSLSAAAAGGKNNNNNNNQGKRTLYRISALDGLQLGQPIAIVGLLRFAPWLVDNNFDPLSSANTMTAAQLQALMSASQQNKAARWSKGWLLEDFSGTLPLEIPASEDINMFCSNSLIGDGTVAVIHGQWAGKTIRVEQILLPPGETRDQTKAQVGTIEDFFGGRPSDMHAANRAFNDSTSNIAILVSDIKISIASNAEKLMRVLREFENRSEEMDVSKVTFVLVGDFIASVDRSSSNSSTNASSNFKSNSTVGSALDVSYLGQDRATINVAHDLDSLGNETIQRLDAPTPATTLTQTLRDFANQIAIQCPRVAANSEFILIPGPNDCCATGAGIYPRSPLVSTAVAAFAEKCPRTLAAPNPCRLRFYTQEYTICRAALHKTFAASSIETIEGKSKGENGDRVVINKSSKQQKSEKRVSENGEVLLDDQENNNEDDDNAFAKKEPFAELAESIVRGGFWFPIPSEGIISSGASTKKQNQPQQQQQGAEDKAKSTLQLKEDSGVATNTQQQPLLLRSWGGIRWTLDRALYHGGAPHHPHMSFMCDDTACWTCNVDDVSCANPGSFAVNGIFAWISPTDKTVDFNTMEN